MAKKVLIVSPVPTHPPHRGNRQRILQIARLFMDSGFTVELAVGRNTRISDEAKNFWMAIHSLINSPTWRPSKKNVTLDAWYPPGLGEEIAKIVEKNGVDIVLVNYIFHSKLLDHLPDNILKIIDTHDVFTDRKKIGQGNPFRGGFFSCSAKDEATYLERANAVFSINRDDSSYFRTICPTLRIFDIPFVYDRNEIGPQTPSFLRDASPSTPREFGLVMSANDLNLASLYRFIQAVDDVYGEFPPFTVKVAGDIDKIAFRFFPHRIFKFKRRWLRYIGTVEDIETFYSSVDVALVPVIDGSGMAIKFSEAIHFGVPTISTARGSRGHATTYPDHQLTGISELVARMGSLSPDNLMDTIEEGNSLISALISIIENQWGLFERFVESR